MRDADETVTGLSVVCGRVRPVKIGALNAGEFKAALAKTSRRLPDEEDAKWSAKAKAGRESGIQSAKETVNRVKRRNCADSSGI